MRDYLQKVQKRVSGVSGGRNGGLCGGWAGVVPPVSNVNSARGAVVQRNGVTSFHAYSVEHKLNAAIGALEPEHFARAQSISQQLIPQGGHAGAPALNQLGVTFLLNGGRCHRDLLQCVSR